MTTHHLSVTRNKAESESERERARGRESEVVRKRDGLMMELE